MNRVLLPVVAAFLLLSAALQAQEGASTSRIQKQHKITAFQKAHMKQTEASILEGLQSDSPTLQQSSVQNLRVLEQLYTDVSFSSIIAPLGDFVKNPQADPLARILAALALDELHSDAGDAMIQGVADSSEDKELQSLCKALLVGGK